MSHLKEREEKNCLNCNAHIYGKYCHICGQENIEPKESFWHLATHFIYDIIHFDGKFFSSLKFLLLKPGYISHEYLRGRRTSYLHPIRMYVFASAIFFIVFFSFIIKPDEIEKAVNTTSPLSAEKVSVIKDSLQNKLNAENDTSEKKEIQNLLSAITNYENVTEKKNGDSATKNNGDTTEIKINNSNAHVKVFREENLPETVTAYDSAQNALPQDKRDGWLRRAVIKTGISINMRYKENPEDFKRNAIEKFFHSVPQVMFVTLPLIALIMQLLYIRNRKKFFYVNHVIFLTHVYVALFICQLVNFALSGLQNLSGWAIFSWLSILVSAYMFIYTPWAMKNFYEQNIFKTIIKYLILFVTAIFLFFIVISVYAIKSMM